MGRYFGLPISMILLALSILTFKWIFPETSSRKILAFSAIAFVVIFTGYFLYCEKISIAEELKREEEGKRKK